jgi:uncharacterized protein YcgI (DUF1989 family)
MSGYRSSYGMLCYIEQLLGDELPENYGYSVVDVEGAQQLELRAWSYAAPEKTKRTWIDYKHANDDARIQKAVDRLVGYVTASGRRR